MAVSCARLTGAPRCWSTMAGAAPIPALSRGRKAAIGTAVVAALVAILVMIFPAQEPRGRPALQQCRAKLPAACQNPDVKSEPGQVNFACAKTTRQILWVFALMTSADNPNFADRKTGRLGLEPITAAQGGEVAWSLNLHHPYNPSNPIDSLEVAARAINNIVGGATLTGANGKPVVQPGLESHSANCLRYTGSAAITSRAGFPSLCAKPVTSPAGQAALVAGIYRSGLSVPHPRPLVTPSCCSRTRQSRRRTGPGHPEAAARFETAGVTQTPRCKSARYPTVPARSGMR
jgi:hypothetical protein